MATRLLRALLVALVSLTPLTIGTVWAQADPLAITSPTFGEDTTPLITGVGTPGKTIYVELDGSLLGTATVAGDSTWSFQVGDAEALTADHEFLVFTEEAGLPGGGEWVLHPYSVVAPPWEISIDSLTDGDVVGPSFLVSGHVVPNGRMLPDLFVWVDGQQVATIGYHTPETTWESLAISLPAGPHELRIVASDLSGDQVSPPLHFTVDLTPPASAVLITPGAGSIATSDHPVFSGTGEPGSRVQLVWPGSGDRIIEPIIVGPDGTWSAPTTTTSETAPFDPFDWVTALSPPVANVRLLLLTTDPVGNSTVTSVEFTMDLRGPSATPTPTVTPTPTPTASASASASATVPVATSSGGSGANTAAVGALAMTGTEVLPLGLAGLVLTGFGAAMVLVKRARAGARH